MEPRNKWLWLLAAVVFAVCMTVYMLSEFVIHPQSSMMTLGGDAGKNYLSYFYHCLYDKGTWYHGMNYPYGEHIVYADGQSLLTIPISYLNQYVHFKKTTVLAIMNLFIGLSYVVGMVYLYKTLLQFKVAPWAAIIFSGLIISLSPQVFRAEVHFALANMCMVPMLFYWFVKYNEGGKWKYMLYAFILSSLMAFHHPYFGGLLFVWIALYTLGYWILYRKDVKEKMRHTIPPILCLLGVYAVVSIFMKLTDPVQDRPVYPYGALQTVTNLSLITTSEHSPIWKYIAAHTHMLPAETWNEGYIYIGVTAVVVCVVSVIMAIIKKMRKQQTDVNSAGVFPAIWLFIALGALLLATGIPFVWNMENLFEYMSILRQFRALGRFGWIFYYIITVYTAVRLYGWYAKALAQRKTVMAWAILLLPMLVWAKESKAYIKHMHHAATSAFYNYCTLFSIYQVNCEEFLQRRHMAGSDFQGVIMLPFIEIGSEKLWIHEMEGWVVTLGAKPALQLHLPMVNVMMSRTSLSQTEKQVRLLGGPFADKPLLKDIPNNKPFLLMHFKNDSLDLDQQYLISVSQPLGEFSDCDVYALYPDRLRASDKAHTDSATQVAAQMHAGDSCVYADGTWFTDHFDKGTAAQKFFGTASALPVAGDGKQYVDRIPVHPAHDNDWYECSVWILLQAKDYRSPEFSVEIMDSAGKMIKEDRMNGKESVDNNGMWFRASCYFRLPANTAVVQCRQIAYKLPCYFALDELMLRPAHSLIISKAADGRVMANNHLLGAVK